MINISGAKYRTSMGWLKNLNNFQCQSTDLTAFLLNKISLSMFAQPYDVLVVVTMHPQTSLRDINDRRRKYKMWVFT